MSAAEVASTPTDWAAVISAIVTGVAAVTGIVVTSWQARSAQEAASRDLKESLKVQTDIIEYRSLAADRRAIQAQKMRIYATFQGCVDDLIAMAELGKQQEEEFSKARSAMLRAAAQVTLVAPPEVGVPAGRVKQQLVSGIGRQGFSSDFHPGKILPHRAELAIEMKLDLDKYQPSDEAEPEQSKTAGVQTEHRLRSRAARWIGRARA